MDDIIDRLLIKTGRELTSVIEPGRYIAAECGVLLGYVRAVKYNSGVKYIGTDIGFTTLIRPALYNSFHELEAYTADGGYPRETEPATVVGNLCETGDIIANDRPLPLVREGDIIGVMDAGAYCMSMASNYNSRSRPAEVLICKNGELKLIRRRDTAEDLIKPYIL
jgi:diaminopimelate decarboxylase